MLFQNEESSLKLDVVNYEFPADGGEKESDDRNWLLLRCTWTREDGEIVKATNACLLTYELRDLAAGLKLLRAGLKDSYESAFTEPYFDFAAQSDGEGKFTVSVSFYLPDTMDGDDMAEIECTMSPDAIRTLTDELDVLCKKYPDRA